jgi:hypothetical protein
MNFKSKLEHIRQWIIIVVFQCKLQPTKIAESIFNLNGITLQPYLNEDYSVYTSKGTKTNASLKKLINDLRIFYVFVVVSLVFFNLFIYVKLVQTSHAFIYLPITVAVVNSELILLFYYILSSIIKTRLYDAQGENQ